MQTCPLTGLAGFLANKRVDWRAVHLGLDTRLNRLSLGVPRNVSRPRWLRRVRGD